MEEKTLIDILPYIRITTLTNLHSYHQLKLYQIMFIAMVLKLGIYVDSGQEVKRLDEIDANNFASQVRLIA